MKCALDLYTQTRCMFYARKINSKLRVRLFEDNFSVDFQANDVPILQAKGAKTVVSALSWRNS